VSVPTPVHSRLPATDRRAQLLEVALNLFSKKGFDGTTTKEIAAAAGVTEAIVFRHFPTKQALYQAVLDHHSDCPAFHRWMDEARRSMEQNNDEGLMRAIAAAVLETYRSDPRMERLMLFAALEGQETALNHYRSVSIPIYEILCEYIVRRQHDGALAAFPPGAILAAISGMAQRYAVFTRLFGFPSELSHDEAVETFTRILMDGIKPRATK
jgi:TetR/AcrR family transcriptional regulator